MHKPIHTLGFIAAISLLLIAISLVIPDNGLTITERVTIKYPSFHSLFLSQPTQKKDISNIIALADSAEHSAKTNKDTISLTVKNNFVQLNTNIQYKDDSRQSLSHFFDALQNITNETNSIRVLHYGDSQIEGDRITDYLRMKLQGQFGGAGPGLISFLPVAPSVINKLSWSENWDRYPVFIGKDKRVKHSNYGVLAHITRFSNYNELQDTTHHKSAWVKMTTSKNGGVQAAAYHTIKLFYGGAKTKTQVEFYENGVLNNTDSLSVGGYFNVKQYQLNQKASLQEFKFQGKNSPDFYGISLEGDKGIMIDNIGLRGSSGTFFNQINLNQLQQFYEYLNTKLIILQFGGNTLPYITTTEQAAQYGKYLKVQILTIKKIAPHASLLIIGPADMSVKNGTVYETHPQLEDLRDAIQKTAFETDCAFFDLYNCMGGKNSMVSWVEAGIGAKDYIHFSAGGARKIAVLLYNSLINDYSNYIQLNKTH